MCQQSGRQVVTCVYIHPKPLPTNLLNWGQYPNVHVKISNVGQRSNMPYPHRDTHDMIKRIYDVYGPERLMWGTDFPHVFRSCGYRGSLDLIRDHMFFNDDDLEKKKAADLCDQWPFVCGLFLLLDFYFVTFFEGGGNFPREMERKEQMEQRQSPADDRVDIWSCTPEEREWIIGLALVFFVPLLGLVLWRDWDKIIGLDRDGLIDLAISIGHVGIFAVVFAFLVIQGVGMRTLLVEKYRERQDRKLKERDAQWRRAWQERLPGTPLPPFVDDDTDNDRKQ